MVTSDALYSGLWRHDRHTGNQTSQSQTHTRRATQFLRNTAHNEPFHHRAASSRERPCAGMSHCCSSSVDEKRRRTKLPGRANTRVPTNAGHSARTGGNPRPTWRNFKPWLLWLEHRLWKSSSVQGNELAPKTENNGLFFRNKGRYYCGRQHKGFIHQIMCQLNLGRLT